jgi:hypothetical protein
MKKIGGQVAGAGAVKSPKARQRRFESAMKRV